MSAVMKSRGRVLTRQQVRFNEAPVRLGSPEHCLHQEPSVSVKTDPQSGDVIEIVVQCTCGEITIVACDYGGAS